jgi:hypothetical protein
MLQSFFLWLGLHPCETETSSVIISSPVGIVPLSFKLPLLRFEELPPAGLSKMRRPESG